MASERVYKEIFKSIWAPHLFAAASFLFSLFALGGLYDGIPFVWAGVYWGLSIPFLLYALYLSKRHRLQAFPRPGWSVQYSKLRALLYSSILSPVFIYAAGVSLLAAGMGLFCISLARAGLNSEGAFEVFGRILDGAFSVQMSSRMLLAVSPLPILAVTAVLHKTRHRRPSLRKIRNAIGSLFVQLPALALLVLCVVLFLNDRPVGLLWGMAVVVSLGVLTVGARRVLRRVRTK